MSDLTPARQNLADQITAIIVSILPADMDGTTIVTALTASPEGRKALCAVAQELNAEAVQAGMDNLAEVFADGLRQIGRTVSDAIRPKPNAESDPAGTVIPNDDNTSDGEG